MRLVSISGRVINKNVKSKKIDWSGKSRSKFQVEIKNLLFPLWKNCIVYEEFPVYGTRLSVDFYNASRQIAVEVQGGQHLAFNPFFHRGRQDFGYQCEKDNKKRLWCDFNEIRLIEILPEDMKFLKNSDDLRKMIEDRLDRYISIDSV